MGIRQVKAFRSEVYEAIDTEREYQDKKWGTDENHYHSLAEWLVYIENYVNEAKHIATRLPEPLSSQKVLDIMRKVTAMGVCAMEQHGAPKRDIDETPPLPGWPSNLRKP